MSRNGEHCTDQSPDRSHVVGGVSSDMHRRVGPMIDSPIKRGKHRGSSRWALHHPEHEDPQRGIVSRLVPSWKLAADLERHRTNRPGTHRVILDDRSGPERPIGSSRTDATAFEVILEEHEAVFTADSPPTHDPLLGHRRPKPSPTPATPRNIEVDPLPTNVFDRSHLLPAAEPEESSSLASLFGFGEHQVTFDRPPDHHEEPDHTAWDSLPSLSDVAVDRGEYHNTETTIQRLWDATEHHPIVMDMDEVVISQAPARLTDSRRFRRSVMAGAVVALVVTGWAIREIGAQPERVAIAREVQYSTAADQMEAAIGPIELSLGLVPSSEVSASDLSRFTGELDVLDGIARSAAALAAEPLPRAPIVGSSLPIDALILPKRLLEQASLQAHNVERRIGDAVSYRLTFANTFDLPLLPGEATLQEIGTIGGDLSVALAETEQLLSQLPDDAFFARHRQEAVDLVTSLESAQADYFIALRNQDSVAASQIRDAMLRSIAHIQGGLDEPLAATEAWAKTQIGQLRDVIDEIQELVSG